LLIRISKGIIDDLNNTKFSLASLESVDFTKEVSEKYLNQKDELEKMALSINNLQNSMRKTITNIADSSKSLTISSDNLFEPSKDSTIASEEIENTVGRPITVFFIPTLSKKLVCFLALSTHHMNGIIENNIIYNMALISKLMLSIYFSPLL